MNKNINNKFFKSLLLLEIIIFSLLITDINSKLGDKVLRVKSMNKNNDNTNLIHEENLDKMADNEKNNEYLYYLDEVNNNKINNFNNNYNNYDSVDYNYLNENSYGENIKIVSNYVNPNLARLGANNLSLHEGARIVHQIISKPFVKKGNNSNSISGNTNTEDNKVKTFLEFN